MPSEEDQALSGNGDQFLLATRLMLPPIRSDVIVRSRLIAQLEVALQGPLTLLTAPAGFGKTTLLCTLLHQVQWPAGWISLDHNDNDLARFWSYVFAALERVHPGVSRAARMLLSGLRPPPIEAILITVLNQLVALERDSVLVLDDYQCISTPTIHASLGFFVEHLPPRMHIIIATRTSPLLPLARWRARGLLTELHSTDLRFTVEETDAFLHRSAGLALPQEDIQALDRRAEGWIVGIKLAALSMQKHPDVSTFIKNFTGSHRYIVDYLAQEVFTRQEAGIQVFLLRTSILARLSASLCEAVTGEANGQELLEQIEQANLFLQPLDDERRWYRYHPLFAEWLHYRLQSTQPKLLPALHRAASLWYEQEQFLPEAIEHALAVPDFQRAVVLMEAVGSSMMKRGELMTFQTWLDLLPAAFVCSHPNIVMLQAWILFLTGQYSAAEQMLQDMEQRYGITVSMCTVQDAQNLPEEQQRSISLMGEIAAIRASIAIIQGDGSSTIAYARQALLYLSAKSVLRGLLTWYLGLACWLVGDLEPAMKAMKSALAYSLADNNLYMAFMTTHDLASLYALQGSLHRAEQLYQQAFQQVGEQGGSTPALGPVNVGMGSLQYEWNDLEAAERSLREGIEQCLHMENGRTALQGLMTLIQVRHARGDLAAAHELLQQLSKLAQNPNVPSVQARFAIAFQAYMAQVQGDQAAAWRWVQACDLPPIVDGSVASQLIGEYLILARVQITQGKITTALACLDRLLSHAEATGCTKRAINVLVVKVCAYQALGDEKAALAALENALTLAEPEGYIRSFVDEGPALGSLLTQLAIPLRAAQRHPTPHFSLHYVETVLAAFPDPPLTTMTTSSQSIPPTPMPEALADPLSKREREVLELIVAGCSNREIADRLVLTVGTVKWYVNSIYGKLQVESRTRAIARARALGLL